MYKHYKFYQQWSKSKLPFIGVKPNIIEINELAKPSNSELNAILRQIHQFNYCVYQSKSPVDEVAIGIFGNHLGLKTLDAHLCASEDKVTSLQHKPDHQDSFYIPYTNKAINWHTDGYYNSPDQMVYSLILHCVQPAFEGGESGLIDQDQVFINLMNENPEYISALMAPNVMTIPENRQNGVLIRPETSTAIFMVLNENHDVLMRYTMRKRNILFKHDTLTQEALACLDECIDSNLSIRFMHKLEAGQGVVGNNILHKRTAFEDKFGLERLYYRARYYNRININ